MDLRDGQSQVLGMGFGPGPVDAISCHPFSRWFIQRLYMVDLVTLAAQSLCSQCSFWSTTYLGFEKVGSRQTGASCQSSLATDHWFAVGKRRLGKSYITFILLDWIFS